MAAPGRGHAVEIVSVIDVEAPEFARLIPSTIQRIGSEDKEKSQGRQKQDEQSQGKGEHGKGGDDRLVLNSVQIGVPPGESIPNYKECCHAGRSKHLLGETLVNATFNL